jgi:hypothetical protein
MLNAVKLSTAPLDEEVEMLHRVQHDNYFIVTG